MALPLAYGAAVAGTLAATRGCGVMRSMYWFSPSHKDDPACVRAYDGHGMVQMRWGGGLHAVGATPPGPPESWWQPPPMKARGLKTSLNAPSGGPDLKAFYSRGAVVLVFNKHNTEWDGPPVNSLGVETLTVLLDMLLDRGCLPVYSRPVNFLDNSLVQPFGDKELIRGRYAGRVLLVEDWAAANPKLNANGLQMALFARGSHAVTVQGGPAAMAGYFVQPGGDLLVLHKRGLETSSGEYNLIYARFNGARYTVLQDENALLAAVANATQWCA